MTALAQVRTDQNWAGLVVVLGILVLSLVAWVYFFWIEGGRTRLTLARVIRGLADASTGPDHAVCSNPDCGVEICCCRTAGECNGCETLGCSHGEGLCWTCRLGCRECMAEQDLEWAGRR